MNPALRLASAVALSSILLACPSVEERQTSAREAAQNAILRGERQDALEAIEAFREAKPEDPETVLEYVSLLAKAGEAPQAVWELESAIERFDDDELRIALAALLIQLNDPSRAQRVLADVPESSEQRPYAQLVYARAELKLGRLDEALEGLRKIERDYPEARGVRMPRIVALLEERRFDEARAAIAEARAETEEPREIEVLRHLEANLLLEETSGGDREAAIEGLARLLEEAPEDPELWQMLVFQLAQQRRHEEARERLTAAIAEDPDRMLLYGLLASVEAAMGRYEDAEATVEAWIERAPLATAYVSLAQLRSQRGDNEAALAAIDRGLASDLDLGAELLRAARIETLLGLGRTAEAAEALAALENEDMDRRVTELLRARLELETGQAGRARDRLERLVPERDDAAGQYWLARALEATGDPIGAERRYVRAAMIDPNDTGAAKQAYRLAAARGDWRSAAQFAQRATAVAPNDADAWRALVAAHVELGLGAQAERMVAMAEPVLGDDPGLRALEVAALRIQGRSDEAVERATAALERHPGEIALINQRALARVRAGQGDAAIDELRTAIAENPDSAVLQQSLATVFYLTGRAAEGDAAVDRALELDPADLRPLRGRLEYRVARRDFSGAIADADRYLAGQPGDAHAHYLSGLAHEHSGRTSEAADAYRRAAELDAKAVAPRNNLAVLLGRLGEQEEALVAAQQAYRLAPENPDVLDTLGTLYLEAGFVDRAISVLEEARALRPDHPEVSYHLALAYREAGRREEARTLLVALQPRAPEPLRGDVEAALATVQ